MDTASLTAGGRSVARGVGMGSTSGAASAEIRVFPLRDIP